MWSISAQLVVLQLAINVSNCMTHVYHLSLAYSTLFLKLVGPATHLKSSLVGPLSDCMQLTPLWLLTSKGRLTQFVASYREQQEELSSDSSDEHINSELYSYLSSQSSRVGSDSGSD